MHEEVEINNKHIVVWFSCGAASAVAAKKTVEIYGNTNRISIVNNPVDEEHPDNRRFLKDVSAWLGMPIIEAVNPKVKTTSAVDIWNSRDFMSSPNGAPCTLELKKNARRHFEETNKIDYHVFGFTVEEEGRHKNFVKYERENVIPVLIALGITKQMCFDIVREARIELPEIYKLGYPNANCIGCVKATSPTYWNHVRKTFPEIFQSRAEQSRRIGARLVRYKKKRLFLDELPPEAKGYKMKSYECGIFCETKPPKKNK